MFCVLFLPAVATARFHCVHLNALLNEAHAPKKSARLRSRAQSQTQDRSSLPRARRCERIVRSRWLLGRRVRRRRRPARQHHHARTDFDLLIEIRHVFIGEADTARRHERANRGWLVGAVNAVKRLAEIERARAKWIAFTTSHEARQIGLTLDHLGGRMPIRPLGHAGDLLGAGPGETLTSDADAVAHRLAARHHEIKVGVRRIDHDRADRLARRIVDDGAAQIRRQLLGRPGLRTILGRQRRVDTALLRTTFLLASFLLTSRRLLLAADWCRRTQDVERTREQALPWLRLITWLLFHATKPATRVRLVSWRLLLITRLVARTTIAAARI